MNAIASTAPDRSILFPQDATPGQPCAPALRESRSASAYVALGSSAALPREGVPKLRGPKALPQSGEAKRSVYDSMQEVLAQMQIAVLNTFRSEAKMTTAATTSEMRMVQQIQISKRDQGKAIMKASITGAAVGLTGMCVGAKHSIAGQKQGILTRSRKHQKAKHLDSIIPQVARGEVVEGNTLTLDQLQRKRDSTRRKFEMASQSSQLAQTRGDLLMRGSSQLASLSDAFGRQASIGYEADQRAAEFVSQVNQRKAHGHMNNRNASVDIDRRSIDARQRLSETESAVMAHVANATRV